MNKTKRMMMGVLTTLMAGSLVACNNTDESLPPPNDQDCDDWEWDPSTSTYVCDDDDSAYYRHYYYGGRYYPSKRSLEKSSSYKSYQTTQEFQNRAKSGIGSGTKGGSFGG
ncbi:hypothetical protein B0I26_108108 [Anoxybacillus vitaminiphilus]|uniref:Aminotransferase yhxA n=1 Tax=Paranoxybacillus vitaminiphilus TaxID=581036 RepID=A0A327YD56_9BACL|nr:hypothetical protein [Anoxybacillus vitaminiphilus]RAK18933.1 hypothetical protein B0I26_108108 [Anoxybacillus vitaminiphilus]